MTHKPILYAIVLVAALVGQLLSSCRHASVGKHAAQTDSVDWNDSCYAILNQALTYYNNNQTDSLDHYARPAMQLCATHGQRQCYYNLWALMAEAYVWDNRFDKATAEALSMKDEAQLRHDDFGLFLAYKTLGIGYAHAGDSNEAETYLKKAVNTSPPDATPAELFYCYHALCQEQLKLKRYAAADTTLRDLRRVAHRYPLNPGDKEAAVYANFRFTYHSALADYMLATADYPQAAIAIDSAAYYEDIAGNSLLNLVAIAQQRSRLARQQGHTDEALRHSARLMDLAAQVDDNSNMATALEERAKVLEKAGRFDEALAMFHRLAALKDSLAAIDRHDRLNQLDKQYALSELQEANRQLEQRSRFTTGSTAMIMGIATILLFLVYNSRWSRQLEIKNRQLQRERNVVVAKNKQLAIERDRAEAASKAKTAFIQGMTHEIRTPLNHISGFTQVLAMTEVELPDAERIEACHRIKEGTHQLTNILDDLIQVSELESSTQLPPPEEYYPALFVPQAIEAIRPSVAPGVAIEGHCQVSDELAICTHPRMIQTVLSRLLDNAAKFTRQGSITLSLTQDGDNLHFSVADTGPGIPEDKRQLIFERFAKLDRFVQGAGLGLSVARMIAERLGGTLTLAPEYTGGAKFDFLLPIDGTSQKQNIS